MAYAGIDYSMGQSNYDKETGIHYGVIAQNSVSGDAMNDMEPDYGDPHCPKCGNDAVSLDAITEDTDEWEHAKWECDDYACAECEYVFGSESAYPDESQGFTYDRDGYKLIDCLDFDVFVLKSPYYTFAQYCSPCVPGAGNLDHPVDDGVKCYCLGHDWFEDGKAPYPVYSVADGSLVLAN